MKLLLLLAFGVMASLGDKEQLLREFSIGNHQFTADVYKQLLKSNGGNILVCPISAEIILALTQFGARDDTAKQIASALHLPESFEKNQEIFTALKQDLHSTQTYTLHSANKVYLHQGFEINNKFKEVAVNVFNADIQNIDFSKNVEAVSEINKWVSDRTENYIQNLLAPAVVSGATRAVLVNALFFKGKWEKQFKKRSTVKKPFYLNADNHVDVDMMSTIYSFYYYESSELNAQVLQMFYKGDDISMTFVLPKEKEGLNHLEQNIDQVFGHFNYSVKQVEVLIPKFKVETTINFVPILKALGINDAFESNANFGGFGSGRLKIDNVIQKNFVEVDENGTKAASATAVIIGLGASLPPRPQARFVADHPFIYYIKKGNTILFAGSVKQF